MIGFVQKERETRFYGHNLPMKFWGRYSTLFSNKPYLSAKEPSLAILNSDVNSAFNLIPTKRQWSMVLSAVSLLPQTS
jgi:hypothetical protein